MAKVPHYLLQVRTKLKFLRSLMEKKVAKIIFLDFDGVLNTEYHQRQLQFEGKIWQDKHGAMRVINILNQQ